MEYDATSDFEHCAHCRGVWHGMPVKFRDGSECLGSHQPLPRTTNRWEEES